MSGTIPKTATMTDVSSENTADEKGLISSSTEKNNVVATGPPDGGLLAWSQVFAGHLIAFNAWGFINSYGIFQAYLIEALSENSSNISWVGGVQVFLVMFLGTFSGRALDAGHYHSCAVLGMFLQVVGVMMTSLVKTYWQLFLAQGLCQGIGAGLVFTPTMAIVSSYFAKKRALAVVGMSSGTATGGIIFPVIARQCLGSLGFGWTLRIMGFLILFNSAVALAIIRPRNMSRKSGPIVELSLFLDPWYGCCALGLFFAMFGQYFAFFYISSFAEDALHSSEQVGFDLLIAVNAMGIPGRFIPAYLSDWYIGPLNTLLISTAATGILLYGWTGVSTVSSYWAFVILLGYFAASISSFFPAALVATRRDPSKIGTEIGMCFSLMAIGCLCGPPIAGALIDKTGEYLAAQLFGGSVMIVGVFLMSVSRYVQVGPRLFIRA